MDESPSYSICFALGITVMRQSALRRNAIAILILPLLLSACAGGSGNFLSFLTPAKVTWKDTSWCTPLSLRLVLFRVAKKFGPVTVYSTHRWPLENARKGGKPKSYHLTCRAIDFQVAGGNPAAIKRYLMSQPAVGGYSYYPHKNFFHIDTGPRRTW